MADTKVSYPVEAVLGFCDSTKEMVTGYKTRMVAAGIDPSAMLTALDPAKADLTAKNNVQEGIKTQLSQQTALVEAARDKAYNIGSNLIDQIISAFGRNSEEAKQAINLRKALHPQKASAKAAKTTPNP